MNTLKFYPIKLRKIYELNIRNAGIESPPEKYHNTIFWISLILTVLISTVLYFFGVTAFSFIIIFFLIHAFFFFKTSLQASARIRKMEELFPDVISLMASNLRSGITIEKAFLMAARPEFDPLDKEILKTGKEITTGQDVVIALKIMSDRINSEKISKVIALIISGLKAGGNISDLLDQTSRNMKEKEVLEKKTRSTILMYVIFIFFAVGAGAPVLFGLSSVLVEIVIGLTSKLPSSALSSTASSSINIPLNFSQVSISLNFVIYFSVIFIIVTDLISCFVIGLVNKGEGKEGLKYLIPLIIISLSIFFVVRTVLSGLLKGAISFL
ncbi:MAG: type II secretion system F family protein [Nanoarchaeota archaeon]